METLNQRLVFVKTFDFFRRSSVIKILYSNGSFCVYTCAIRRTWAYICFAPIWSPSFTSAYEEYRRIIIFLTPRHWLARLFLEIAFL